MAKTQIEALKASQAKTKALKKHLLDGEINELFGKGNWKNLFGHLDIASLVLFRIVFGMIMLWEVTRYLNKGWISRYWIDPQFNFAYWPFHWLEPLPGNGMYALFYAMGIFAVMIILGLFYRFSTISFFLCFTYMFLLEQTRYLNHFYLISLISFVIIFLPANRAASLDSLLFKNIRSQTVPSWSLWLVRFMLAVPYFYGGVAKINKDWFQGQPLDSWLKADASIPIVGPYLDERWMILGLSYSGLLLDLLIVPALLYKRTRVMGFIAIFFFHLLNDQMFIIGIFPWFMMFATTLFFHPSWPRRVYNALRSEKKSWALKIASREAILPPINLSKSQKALLIGMTCWASFQMLYPLRHYAIPGNVSWTEEGHRFAWHMKLRTKRGMGTYKIENIKTGQIEEVKARDFMPGWQAKKLEAKPILIWDFCQKLKKEYAKKGQEVRIYADVQAKLNGRPYQQLIDPEVDLAAQPRPLIPPQSWILPLKTPLVHAHK